MPASLLAGWVGDPAAGWSVGTFGALAEFLRDADEPATIEDTSVVTARGGLRVEVAAHGDDVRPVAWERRAGDGWTHAVALCLPSARAAGPGRSVITELGPDVDALRPQDRDAVLVDLGVGAPHLEACVRTEDPELLAALRSAEGSPLFSSPAAGALVAAGPHRVFRSALARAEVFTPIPPPDGVSPDGPHTHLLPRLLAHGRTHAATDPVPEGWTPCVAVHPPHPTRAIDGRRVAVRPEHHEAFADVLDRWGDPAQVAAKRRVVKALATSPTPPPWARQRAWRSVVDLVLIQAEELGTETPHHHEWREHVPRERASGGEQPLTHDPAQG